MASTNPRSRSALLSLNLCVVAALACVEDAHAQRENERKLPAATIFDRSYYKDYERATFSFEHGLRDDPGRKITRNSWDLDLTRGKLTVDSTGSDRSKIMDLGEVLPRAFSRMPLDPGPFETSCEAIEGHAYFIASLDDDTDLATVIFVRSAEYERQCTFDWYTTDGSGRAQGSIADPRNGRRWIEILAQLRAAQPDRQGNRLERPHIVMQMRAGSQARGNSNRINMLGQANAYGVSVVEAPLEFDKEVTPDEPGRAYCEGGLIPEDHMFVVSKITWSGTARGDSEGRGRFALTVGGELVYKSEQTNAPMSGSLSKRIEILAGSEPNTYLEVANSSSGNVRIEGELIPRPGRGGFGAANAGFFKQHDPMPATPILSEPVVELQARAGSASGSEIRIDLRGRKHSYVNSVSRQPLDMKSDVTMDEPTSVYSKAGEVGPNRVFVVTRVDYEGAVFGEKGYVRIVVGGRKIAEIKPADKTAKKTWTGLIEVPEHEESRTYLSISDASRGSAKISGRFEQR